MTWSRKSQSRFPTSKRMRFLRRLDRHLEKQGNAENHHWTKDESIVALRYTHQSDCHFSVCYPPDPMRFSSYVTSPTTASRGGNDRPPSPSERNTASTATYRPPKVQGKASNGPPEEHRPIRFCRRLSNVASKVGGSLSYINPASSHGGAYLPYSNTARSGLSDFSVSYSFVVSINDPVSAAVHEAVLEFILWSQ